MRSDMFLSKHRIAVPAWLKVESEKDIVSFPLSPILSPSQIVQCSHLAPSAAGHADVLNYLLQNFRRVRIDQCNHLGFTALMKAAIQGRTRCAKLLLFAGQFCADQSLSCIQRRGVDFGSVGSEWHWAVK